MDEKVVNKSFPSTNSIAVSNEGLHARYRLTNLEKRALLCMTADLDSLDNNADLGVDVGTGQQYFLIREQPVKDFLKAMNLNPKRGDAVSALKKIAEGLMGRFIDLNSIQGKRGKGFKLVPFFELIEVNDEAEITENGNITIVNTGEFKIRWQISKYLIPMYKNLRKNFTKLQLTAAVQLKNEYSIRFYEYFTEAWNKCQAIPGETIQLEMSLEQIRFELDFDNKTAGKRTKAKPLFRDAEGNFVFKEFNRSCLKPAIEEIEARNLFKVDIKKKYAKGTHSTEALVFILSKPIVEALEGQNEDGSTPISIVDELIALGVNKRSANSLAKKHDVEYLKFGIKVCKAKRDNGELKSFSSYLFRAYSSDWLMAQWNEEKSRLEKKKQQQKAEQEKNMLEELLKKGEAVRMNDGSIQPLSAEELDTKKLEDSLLEAKFSALNEAEKAQLLDEARDKMNDLQKKLSQGKTCDELWNNPMFSVLIKSCIK